MNSNPSLTTHQLCSWLLLLGQVLWVNDRFPALSFLYLCQRDHCQSRRIWSSTLSFPLFSHVYMTYLNSSFQNNLSHRCLFPLPSVGLIFRRWKKRKKTAILLSFWLYLINKYCSMTILSVFFISNFKYSFSTYRIKSNSLSLTFHINLIVLTNNF